MNQELIKNAIEVEARLRTGSNQPDVRDDGAEIIAALRTALEESQGEEPRIFTADEQRILATHVESVRILALWNRIQSGRSDLLKGEAYYEDRACHFYDLARDLVSRKTYKRMRDE